MFKDIAKCWILLNLTACEVHFENTKIPIENVIGEVGGGFKVRCRDNAVHFMVTLENEFHKIAWSIVQNSS